MVFQRIISGVAASAYLWATIASGLLHDHHPGGHHCDHPQIARHGTQHARFCAHHSDHEHQHEHTPFDDDDDDCAACQFVGQLSLPAMVVSLPRWPDFVTELRELALDSWFDISLDRPRSRGPPA